MLSIQFMFTHAGPTSDHYQGRIQELWKGGGGAAATASAAGAKVLEGPVWRPSLEFQKGGARAPCAPPPPESASDYKYNTMVKWSAQSYLLFPGRVARWRSLGVPRWDRYDCISGRPNCRAWVDITKQGNCNIVVPNTPMLAN